MKTNISNGIATVSLNHQPINLLSPELVNFLLETTSKLNADQSVHLIIFKSDIPDIFSAHLDLHSINTTREGMVGTQNFMRLIDQIKTLRPLTIGVIDGVARGGGNELLQAMDLRIISEKGALGQPEINTNIPTGGQGAIRMARQLGKDKALYYLLTGQDIKGEDAAKMGMATLFVPSSKINALVDQIAQQIISYGGANISMYKDIVEKALTNENKAIEIERDYFVKRAGEHKTQTIIQALLSQGAQTEREIDDLEGIFQDTIKMLKSA
ncbi:enoyl-CoA hydratase/isomerase family protein [Xanthovirga aplysinae]|uniref:enoyl-CoA hydratase/isomerase family protein n=1 Tax=Xanthovirga aplysinae TaxID=2529853 RepID=UPI0012BB6A3A|nr:enoyl-CoA hydratase/isomerase family protein [Xanthovirga aplysinae]MTI32040.1 enoyl-CoA hydratase/isomerase family protein [Xanthovirga aplysinae]